MNIFFIRCKNYHDKLLNSAELFALCPFYCFNLEKCGDASGLRWHIKSDMLSRNSATIKLSTLQLSTWLPSKIRKVWYQVTARLPREQWMLRWCLITFQEWALKRFWGPALDKLRITDLKAPPLLTSAPTFFEDSINKCQSCKSVSVHLLSSFFIVTFKRQRSVDSLSERADTVPVCRRNISGRNKGTDSQRALRLLMCD